MQYLLLALCCAALAHADNPQLHDAIQHQYSHIVAAWNNNSLDGVVAAFNTDASLLLPGSPVIQGIVNIRKTLSSVVPSVTISSLRAIDVDWLHRPSPGEEGYAYARSNVSVQPKSGGPIQISNIVHVFIVTGHGEFQIYIEIIVNGPSQDTPSGRMLPRLAPVAESPVTASNIVRDPVVTQMIQAANTRWMTAFDSGNATAVAELYSHDAWVMPNGAAPVQGRTAIAAVFEGAMKQGVAKAVLTVQDAGVDVRDMYFYERSQFVFYNQAGTVITTGKYVVIWRNMDHGLQLFIDCFNPNS
jgi:uncharacterized protein (TIGR02246 family)